MAKRSRNKEAARERIARMLVLDRIEDPLLASRQTHGVLSLAAQRSWLAAVTASPITVMGSPRGQGLLVAST